MGIQQFAICILRRELIRLRGQVDGAHKFCALSTIVTKVSHELELKLELQPGSMPALAHVARRLGRDLAEPRRVEELESLYFDTPQEKLRQHGVSLRIRQDGKRRLQTVKWLKRSALFDRGESETEINGKGPDWKAIRGTALEPLASKKLRRSLKPVFKTKVRRTIYVVATEAAKIELAVDSGSINAARRSEPVRELELELKAGQSSELFRVARELSRAIPARLCLKSKAERGYELLNGGPPAVVRAGEVELSAGTRVADAFRIVARSCLRQIVGNESGVQAGDSEALHQIRIGLRRLRAAISFFSEITAGPQTDFVEAELKWTTRELSLARDLDVYTSQVLAPFREQYRSSPEFHRLCRDLDRKRVEAFGHAADAIRSDRYRQLLVEAAAWIEAGAWGLAEDEVARTCRGRLIEDYAAEELARRRKKILKKANAFGRLDAGQRHKLRIAVKKFRYAAESIANVFPTRKSKRRWHALLDATKQIQDFLGALNDIAAHEKLSLELLDRQDEDRPKLLRDRAFLAGLMAGRQQAQAGKLTEDATKAFATFEAVKPFWK